MSLKIQEINVLRAPLQCKKAEIKTSEHPFLMDITSPKVLKLKGLLFMLLGLLSGALLLIPRFDWQLLLLFGISVWAFCRAYYFCFYVLHHYADPSFRYAGLLSIARYLVQKPKR